MSAKKTSDTNCGYVITSPRGFSYWWSAKNKWVPLLTNASVYPTIEMALKVKEVLDRKGKGENTVKRKSEIKSYGPTN